MIGEVLGFRLVSIKSLYPFFGLTLSLDKVWDTVCKASLMVKKLKLSKIALAIARKPNSVPQCDARVMTLFTKF